MDAGFISPKIDLVFKQIMRNDAALTGFLCAVLQIEPASVRSLVRTDTHTAPDRPIDDKLGILDVRVTLNDAQEIDIEIQVTNYEFWTNRSLFYWASMYSQQIQTGIKYDSLKKCVSIAILDFVCFASSPKDKYYSRFHLMEDEARFLFSDMIECHTLELPKIPENMKQLILDDQIYQWARFFDAESFEEVKEVSQYNPSIQEAAAELERIASDPALRAQALNRKMAILDHMSAMHEAEKKGRVEGREEGREEGLVDAATRMLNKNMDVPLIAELTGLSEDRIRKIAIEYGNQS